MNVLAFDIETVPDTDGGRRLFGLDGLDDDQVWDAMAALRRQATGGEFQRLHLHRIVVISVAGWVGERFRVWSLGEEDSGERELIERFFEGVDRYVPTLVSWNGSGFDLPVLHYRALIHGVSAPRYWESGGRDADFRWNNYLNRFHERHTDLMDVLAGYQGRGAAPLDEMAALCGFPGKMGMSGGQVLDHVRRGELAPVRDYCETDVLNTCLLYLRFDRMRGRLDEAGYQAACEQVKTALRESQRPHLTAFLQAWENGVTA
ncbi:3'-5' exonuclease [Ectothiorhodospiraceae bacterium WFHF3C12]|nr:3'-5' exonuclease [Ectothiorhodospiraceae bacterium WFHF3C12]